MKAKYLTMAVLAAGLGGPVAAQAENLTLYCAADEVWCQLIARGFEEETGITVDMTRKSSGEIYAQVRPRPAIRKATSGGPEPATRICRPPRKA